MKTLKYFSLAFIIFFVGCTSDDPAESISTNELEGLTLIQEIQNDNHTIELYNTTGALQQGYNAVTLRIKDDADNAINNASITWMPVMHMASMEHSCPFSAIEKTPAKENLYHGYIVFQMAENETEYWTLDISYTINNTTYEASDRISVPASAHKRVLSFTGSDNNRYVMALIDPTNPKVAVNDMSAALFKMESMMNFVPVTGYSISLDPRMPSMGNHGSPNNVNLTDLSTNGLYHGKLSLTMTGYWKINLQLLNATGEIVKGEQVTEDTPESSIFFELEF